MEDYYEYLDSNGVTTLYKLIKDDTVALIDSYSVTINGITTTLDTHINNMDIHTPIADIENMVDTKIAGLVNSAPETLDTLKELSDALGNDSNFATTVVNQISNKADKDSVYTKEETNTLLEGKANSVHNHVVSDITDFPTIPTKTSELTNDSGYITSVSWGDVTSKPELSQVAISGSYSDLSGTPTIPTRTSQLINDSGFLTSSSGVITSVSWSDITDKPNFATVATSGSYTDLSNTPTIPTKVSQLENDMGFGTGGDTSDCVHKTGDEDISGNKTFNNNVTICGNVYDKNVKADLTKTPASNLYTQYRFVDKNNKTMGYVQHVQRNTGVNQLTFIARDSNNTDHGFLVNTNKELLPAGNNTYSLGASGAKWANVYSTNDITNKVITYSVTNHNNTSSMIVSGGSAWDKGSTLFLYGNSHSDHPGAFNLTAKNTTNESKLIGFPNGSLTWGGKDIATTAWVRNYVNSVGRSSISAKYSNATTLTAEGSSPSSASSSIAAYYSNATTLTATKSSAIGSGSFPAVYSDYINIAPTVGTIYTGSQLFSTLNASASGSQSDKVYQTTAKATATFSGAFSSSAKYLCTTANAVRFRAYVSQGTSSAMGSPSVVDNSSARSIFIRVE